MVDAGEATSFSVEVSYLEIYLEMIKDLLNPEGSGAGAGPGGALVVREHARFGVFVPGLERLVASSYDDVAHFLQLGSKERTVAATKMNNSSSRSHSVFTLYLTLELSPESTLRAKINLVDLAGSENQNNTGAKGTRLKEACAINKSLSALGNVISALTSRSKGKSRHIPYRDSILTRLLQESLGGNAKAIMLVAISPASSNYAQTYSTLSFAERAKKIVNRVSRNKESKGDMVKALKAEIDRLRALLESGSETTRAPAVEELEHKLAEQNAIIEELTVTLDQRKERTTLVVSRHEELLAEQGISLAQLGSVMGQQEVPYLVNLNPDPDLASSLVYYLKPGSSVVGSSSKEADIVISGLRILKAHCVLNVGTNSKVTISPLPDGLTYINGKVVREPNTPIANGCRLIFGKSVVFRFMSPLDADPVQEFDWEDAVREMSMVLGITAADFGMGGGGEPVGTSSQATALADAAVLADEGNDLARACQKPVMFSPDLEPAAGGDEDVISIRCTSMISGKTVVVSIPEFRQRVDAMYQLYAEADDPLGLGSHGRGGTGVSNEQSDPFSIYAPDELVGTGSVSLEPLLKGHPVEAQVELDGDEGSVLVRIAVLEAASYKPIRPVRSFDRIEGTDVMLVLDIVSASGVSSMATSGMFVRYSSLYPEEDNLNVTDRCLGESAQPVFNFRERYRVTLDEDIYDAYREIPMTIELWGREDSAETAFSVLDRSMVTVTNGSGGGSEPDAEGVVAKLQEDMAHLRTENASVKAELAESHAKIATQLRIIKSLRHQLDVFGRRAEEGSESGSGGSDASCSRAAGRGGDTGGDTGEGEISLIDGGGDASDGGDVPGFEEGGGAGGGAGGGGGGSGGGDDGKKKSRTCVIS